MSDADTTGLATGISWVSDVGGKGLNALVASVGVGVSEPEVPGDSGDNFDNPGDFNDVSFGVVTVTPGMTDMLGLTASSSGDCDEVEEGGFLRLGGAVTGEGGRTFVNGLLGSGDLAEDHFEYTAEGSP